MHLLENINLSFVMTIKLYNSLSKKVEQFKPLKGNEVRMYSCGPTVYNYAHIGNMRAFLFADFLQRVLRTVGKYEMRWVMNITDIDDKTIRDSSIGSKEWKSEMGEQTESAKDNLKKLTSFYEKSFIDDITKLGINPKHFFAMPKATDYIKEMQELILNIIENGYAYIADGSVYFDVNAWRKDDKYGKLYKIDFDNFKSGYRIDSDQYEREQASDFVLWKEFKENEPYWDFEIAGKNYPGRPGWHIECSAMEYVLLELPFDIHTGGVDLKFPHHEDEIAQSKAGYGIEPTAFWCHNEFLEVEKRKMSKSFGNFFTLRDLIKQGLDPIDIRLAMLSAHYASKYNFTFKGVAAAHKARVRVQEYIYYVWELAKGKVSNDFSGKVEELRNKVFAELADDLHTPRALAAMFSFLNDAQSNNLSVNEAQQMLGFLTEMNDIFAAWQISEEKAKPQSAPQDIIDIANERLEAKKNKDFARADALRSKLSELGYLVKDSKDGYELIKN